MVILIVVFLLFAGTSSCIFSNHSKTHWLSIVEHTDSRHLIIIKRHCYTIKFSDEADDSEIVK